MNKRLIAFLSVLSLTVPMDISNSANLTEKDKKYAQIPYIAWNEFASLSRLSDQKVKVIVHSSTSVDQDSKVLYQSGIENLLNKFSQVYAKDDTFHIIMASNYSDAERLISKVNFELPNYIEYNKRHLSVAKDNLIDGKISFSGGTSSRGCFYPGSIYGDKGNSVTPCPELKGGVIYFFNSNPSQITWIERVGAHEAMHLVMSKINPMSHYRVPDWIIEGTIEGISFAQITNSQNYKQQNYFFNPTPKWRPLIEGQPYELSNLDNQNSGDDRFSIGFLATSLLISEVGMDKYYKFISTMGYPKDWKSDFMAVFGFSAEDFYKKFRDYHSWYFYENGFEVIQGTNYLGITNKKTTITCIKGKTIKKVSAVNPKCPKGYKKK